MSVFIKASQARFHGERGGSGYKSSQSLFCTPGDWVQDKNRQNGEQLKENVYHDPA